MNEEVEFLMTVVCDVFGLTLEEFKANYKSTKRIYSLPRQVLQYLIHFYMGWSSSQIGKVTGEKNHSTVLHSFTVVKNFIDTDVQFRAKIRACHQVCSQKFQSSYKDYNELSDVLLLGEAIKRDINKLSKIDVEQVHRYNALVMKND